MDLTQKGLILKLTGHKYSDNILLVLGRGQMTGNIVIERFWIYKKITNISAATCRCVGLYYCQYIYMNNER